MLTKKKNSKHVVIETPIDLLCSSHSNDTGKETVPSLLSSKSTA